MFTHVYLSLPCLYVFTYVYSCLPRSSTFLLLFTYIYQFLLYHLCLLLSTCLLVFTYVGHCLLVHVNLCLPMFTRVYLCFHLLPMFTRLLMFLMFTNVNPLCTRVYLHLPVFAHASLPVYQCLLVITYFTLAYQCLPLFTYVLHFFTYVYHY